MALTGKETYRLRTELTLAQGIQKTLVPPVHLHTAYFEIYGISEPSDKVGGDLVDVVQLPNGDAVAYLADIAGHAASSKPNTTSCFIAKGIRGYNEMLEFQGAKRNARGSSPRTVKVFTV